MTTNTLIVGDSPIKLWGLTSTERLRRQIRQVRSLKLVDAGQARRYPYSFCSQAGCFARLGFTAGEIDAFKAGNAGKVLIVPAAAPDQTVELTLSLTGFTAGWNALQEANPR